MSILHIWTFSVFVFLKQTKQNIEIYTGFAKNVSSIKMTFCNEKLVYASPPFLLTACNFWRKCVRLGFSGNKHFVCIQGGLHVQKMPLVVVACMAMQTPGKCSCSWSLSLQLAWTEWRIELQPAHEINSSILCLSHADQPSREGEAALYSCAARCSTGASQALLLPCSEATWPGHPWAGPKLPWPWALRQEAVRKDSSGAITNTGCTVSTSQSAVWVSEAYFPWELLVLANFRQDQLEQGVNTLSMLRKIHLKLFIHIPLDQSATKMSLQLFPPSFLPSLALCRFKNKACWPHLTLAGFTPIHSQIYQVLCATSPSTGELPADF